MLRLYWENNKRYLLWFFALIFIFIFTVQVGAKYIVNVLIPLEEAGAVLSGRIVAQILLLGVLFGGTSIAGIIQYLIYTIRPFRTKQLEQAMTIGENVPKYVFIHYIVLVIVAMLPSFLIYQVRAPHLLMLTPIESWPTFYSMLLDIFATVSIVNWLLIIPLLIYNERVFPNVYHNYRTKLIISLVLFAWFMFGFVFQLPGMIESIQTSFVASNTGVVGSLDNYSFANIIVDIIGTVGFILFYIGFTRAYSIKN